MTRRTSFLPALVAMAVLMACAAALLAASAEEAGAAFPGKNGKIAFRAPDGDGTDEIFTSNPDGSALKQRTKAPGNSVSPSWSADGTKIAFASNRDGQDFEIYVKNTTTGEVSQITHNTDQDGGPSWSPDGSKIAFEKYWSLQDPNCPDESRSRDIAVIDADGSDEKVLTKPCIEVEKAPVDWNPKWSPDGSKIAFVSGTCICDNPPYDIMTMNPDGSEVANLTGSSSERGVEFGFDWKPNGKKIVYEKRPLDLETASVWKMSAADGSHQVRLTSGAMDQNPIWSPNGRKILFYRYCGGCETQGIAKMNVDGSNRTNLPGLLGYEDWQPIPVP